MEIDLIVRGICCLRPGLPGISERIRVIGHIGRFLEHSRLWHFANGGAEESFFGSADWMPRNFDRRVEAVAPVTTPHCTTGCARLLATYLADNRQAWDLDASGDVHATPVGSGAGARGSADLRGVAVGRGDRGAHARAAERPGGGTTGGGAGGDRLAGARPVSSGRRRGARVDRQLTRFGARSAPNRG